MLNDIQKAFIKKNLRRSYSEQDLIKECAGDFGRLIASGERDGLPMPVAVEAAKEHFRIYGKAMMDFAEMVKLVPAEKLVPNAHAPNKSEESK